MECPHCCKPGISALSKFIAGTALPARCKFCGKPSSIGGWVLATIGGVFHLVLIGAVIESLYQGSWWPLIVVFLIYALVQIGLTRWAPLKALSDERVANSNKFILALAVVFVLAILLFGLSKR